MLNEQLLEKISNLIEQHGGSEKAELLGAFQDLKTAIADWLDRSDPVGVRPRRVSRVFGVVRHRLQQPGGR